MAKRIEKQEDLQSSDLLVTVAGVNRDYELVIPKELLTRALAEKNLDLRARLIWNEAPTNATGLESDYELVLDGIEDEQSWTDLVEALRRDGNL